MNEEVKTEKYRKLSIAALVAGILTYTIGFIMSGLIYLLSFLPSSKTIDNILGYNDNLYGVYIASYTSISVIIGISLPIAAIVCGSIDLKRIKAGLYSNKGKGFDIAGIWLGSAYFIIGIVAAVVVIVILSLAY
jgi:hypothetical protein